MKLLRNAISLICKNTTNELKLLRSNRFFCTESRRLNKTTNENNLNGKTASISSERNDDEMATNDNSKFLNKGEAIQNNIDTGIIISSYSTVGFRLNQHVQVIGPIILFPRAVFAWHVESPEKVDLDSLMIFGMIQPKVDSLIIGIGSEEATMNIGKTLLKFAHDYKINAEILPTELACTQYNLLTSEGRMVGAALIPPKAISWGEDDMFSTLNLDGKLFTFDMLHSPDIKDVKDGNLKVL